MLKLIAKRYNMVMVNNFSNWSIKMPEYRIESHLKQLMADRKVTISDVAHATRLSDPTVRRWYNNLIKRVDESTVGRLCKFLECTRDELYTVVETPDKSNE